MVVLQMGSASGERMHAKKAPDACKKGFNVQKW